MNILYSTSTDSVPTANERIEGILLEQVSTPTGDVTLRERYDSDSDSGLVWEVEYNEPGCTDDCRWELCSHGDNDLHYRFDSEAEARGKFAYLATYNPELFSR